MQIDCPFRLAMLFIAQSLLFQEFDTIRLHSKPGCVTGDEARLTKPCALEGNQHIAR